MTEERYFSQRRLNPYRGVVQVAAAGRAEARSQDGLTWHLRADDGHGWVRPVGVWVEGEGLRAGVGERFPEVLAALADRPALPFPMADSAELWLLDKATGRPLALLNTGRPDEPLHAVPELEWIPFALTYRGFHSPALAGAEEAFLSGTTRDVQPIRNVDGVGLAAAPGPVTRKAAEIFALRSAESPDP